MTETTSTPAELVREYERYTTGTNEWHRSCLGLVYTDGIKFLAETCGASWLIDLIASHQPAIRRGHSSHYPFQIWKLTLKPSGGAAVEAWSDTPGRPADEDGPASVLLARQEIPYTDWPAELDGYELWVEGGVALLKAEH